LEKKKNLPKTESNGKGNDSTLTHYKFSQKGLKGGSDTGWVLKWGGTS